jgi:hypothetical protein
MEVEVLLRMELPAKADINEVESAVVGAGRQAMAEALRQACREYEKRVVACLRCGSGLVQSEGHARRVVHCSFGVVELHPKVLRCEECGKSFRPAEPLLGCLEGANVTGKLREACVLAGASWPYETAAKVLGDLCGARISAEWVRRLTERSGVEEARAQVESAQKVVCPSAEEARAEEEAQVHQALLAKGKPEVPDLLLIALDGGWVASREQQGGMEGKVGVVASEVEPIGQGRHRLSRRRYVATFGTSERLGELAYAAAQELDGEVARTKVALGDGAEWIKTEVDKHFPEAVRILDWAHLARSVHRAIRQARSGSKHRAERKELHQVVSEALWHGQVDEALARLISLRPGEGQEPVRALEKAISYIQGQRAWLGDYAAWVGEGYPVGSGMVERAVELVINRRLKRRGMRWCRANADALVALRVRTLNSDWDEQTTPLQDAA